MHPILKNQTEMLVVIAGRENGLQSGCFVKENQLDKL